MIKKTTLFIFVVILFSCKDKAPKDYVAFSGKITNHLGNDGFIQSRNFKKEIKISKDGIFKDTIHLKMDGEKYTFSDGNEFTSLYLKNGDNIHLTLNTKEFDETIKYSGKGAENNNYLAKKSLVSEELFSGNLFDLNEEKFKLKIKDFTRIFNDLLNKTKGLDNHLIELEKEEIANSEKALLAQYKDFKEEKARFNSFKGKPSPEFNNYENYNGGTTSLKDLRGKFIYIDVWATWCGPCKAEIPALKALENEFHNKNIAFVSISVDNGRGYKDNSKELAKKGWKEMIKDKDLGGIQLYADKAWKSEFIKDFHINSIPRFLLIDPKGNIVDANAPRPSSKKIKELFNSLLK